MPVGKTAEAPPVVPAAVSSAAVASSAAVPNVAAVVPSVPAVPAVAAKPKPPAPAASVPPVVAAAIVAAAAASAMAMAAADMPTTMKAIMSLLYTAKILGNFQWSIRFLLCQCRFLLFRRSLSTQFLRA